MEQYKNSISSIEDIYDLLQEEFKHEIAHEDTYMRMVESDTISV